MDLVTHLGIPVAAWLSLSAVITASEPAFVPTAAPGGPYGAPVAEVRVLAGFDPPDQRWQSGHRGVDLAAATGDSVYAPADAVVVFAGRVVDRGVVSLEHGGVRTTYEPVDAVVAVGDAVPAGAQIGLVGTGAHCSARCLHWGAIVEPDYIDPLTLLRDYEPVLKPPFD